MQAKALEVRDHMTFVALLAVDMNPTDDLFGSQEWLLRRVGYPCDGRPNVMITYLGGGKIADNDPYGWDDGSRTFPVAHTYIIEHWAEIQDGDVIDVEFILGETQTKKTSEREINKAVR